jgi:ELWxxDGT repeat protein
MIFLNDSYKPTVGSFPSVMTKLGNQVLFIAEEESYSPSLWRTDGTPGGTIKLKDLQMYSSTTIAATDQYLYFTGQHSLQIWKTDGTQEGTVQVIDDPNHLPAKNLVAVKNLVYFDVYYGGLWRSDGTEGGTFALTDAANVRFMQPVGDLLLFMIERENNHFELWRTNGAPSGTFQIYTFSGTRYSIYDPRAADDNIMYFVADDGITGNEVWRTDGTTAGTFRVADLNASDDNFQGSYEMDIANLALWRTELYIIILKHGRCISMMAGN